MKNQQKPTFTMISEVQHMIAPFVIGIRHKVHISDCSLHDICTNINFLQPITNQRISLNSKLRQQRLASNLSCGAFRQIVSFSFVSFLLDKQKERKDELRVLVQEEERNKKFRVSIKKSMKIHKYP